MEFKDTALIESLAVEDYSANVERAIIFKIKAVDVNCPQHIVQRYTLEELDHMVAPLKKRITELENELNTLK